MGRKGKKLKRGGSQVLDSRVSRGPALQEPNGRVPHWLFPQRPDTIWVSIPRRPHLPASGFERFLSGGGDSQNKRL